MEVQPFSCLLLLLFIFSCYALSRKTFIWPFLFFFHCHHFKKMCYRSTLFACVCVFFFSLFSILDLNSSPKKSVQKISTTCRYCTHQAKHRDEKRLCVWRRAIHLLLQEKRLTFRSAKKNKVRYWEAAMVILRPIILLFVCYFAHLISHFTRNDVEDMQHKTMENKILIAFPLCAQL